MKKVAAKSPKRKWKIGIYFQGEKGMGGYFGVDWNGEYVHFETGTPDEFGDSIPESLREEISTALGEDVDEIQTSIDYLCENTGYNV